MSSGFEQKGGGSWLAIGVALLAVSMAGCCGPSFEEAVQAHRKPVEAKVASLAPIREHVLRQPRLERDAVAHEGEPLVVDLAGSSAAGVNASVSYAEDLADPEELGYVWGRIPHTSELNACASLVRRGHQVFDPALPDAYLSAPIGYTAQLQFQRCEAVRTLLVVRTLEFVEPGNPEKAAAGAFQPDLAICDPAARGSADAGMSDADAGAEAGEVAADGGDAGAPIPAPETEIRQRFDGGLVRAEVLVFGMEDAKFRGGFRVEVTSSPRFQGSDVRGDLRGRLRAAIADGIEKHMPGAKVRR